MIWFLKGRQGDIGVSGPVGEAGPNVILYYIPITNMLELCNLYRDYEVFQDQKGHGEKLEKKVTQVSPAYLEDLENQDYL